MNYPEVFRIIYAINLLALTAICFWLPYKAGKKITARIVSVCSVIFISLMFFIDFELFGKLLLLVFGTFYGMSLIVLLILRFIFIFYWLFRVYGIKKEVVIGGVSITITYIVIMIFLLNSVASGSLNFL